MKKSRKNTVAISDTLNWALRPVGFVNRIHHEDEQSNQNSIHGTHHTSSFLRNFLKQ